jgi:hypothetical protein
MMQQQSGARIQLQKNEEVTPGAPTRTCTVSGAPEQVRHNFHAPRGVGVLVAGL